MGHFYTFLNYLYVISGPAVMLLYPLYASVEAIESPSKLDDEQWLAYWILYSFLTLVEMLLEPLLQWIPIWYAMKVVFMAWLVLPQFKGAAFLYDKFVREKLVKRYLRAGKDHVSSKGKGKFLESIEPKKGENEAY